MTAVHGAAQKEIRHGPHHRVSHCTYSYVRGISGDQEGYRLYTMDHNTGSLRLDLEHKWHSSQPPQPVLPPLDQMCDDEVQACFSTTLENYAIRMAHMHVLYVFSGSPREQMLSGLAFNAVFLKTERGPDKT